MTIDSPEFLDMAKKSFEVMMRRGWWPAPFWPGHTWDRWTVKGKGTKLLGRGTGTPSWPDPYTALVEADRAMAELEAPVPDTAHLGAPGGGGRGEP